MPEPAPTPPTAPPPPPPSPPPAAKPNDDPWMTRILGDMGKVMKDGVLEDVIAPAPEPPPAHERHEFTSMGEHARYKAERAEQAKLNEPLKPPEGEPTAPAAPTPAPETGSPPAPVPPAPAEPAPPPGEPVVPPTAPAKPPVKVEKAKPLEELVEGVVRRMQTAKEAAPPAAPPKPATDPEAEFISTLDDNQKAEFELAQFAAAKMPDRYGQLPKRLSEYIKKEVSFVEAKRKEDPDWEPAQDEEYAAFVAHNKPDYLGADRQRIQTERITTEAEARIEAKLRPQLDAAERRVRAQEIKPEVEKVIQSFASEVTANLGANQQAGFASVIAVATEKGWDAALEVDPIAASVAKHYTDQAVALGREYIELASDLKQPETFKQGLPPNAPANQAAMRQAALFAFVNEQEALFAANGGDLRTVNGKTFVNRAEYAALPEAQRSKHWTLGHTDVLSLINHSAVEQAKKAVEHEKQRLAQAGYVRAPRNAEPIKAEPAPPPPPPPTGSPRATVSSSPGAGTPSQAPAPASLMSKEELDRYLSPARGVWPG